MTSRPSRKQPGSRLVDLEQQVAVLVRSVAALNREVGELRSLLIDNAGELARLAAEVRDEDGRDRAP